MSLELYFHPLSSFCQKVLIALYENDTPFEPHFIDLANEASRAELVKLWPLARFPVLHDRARDRIVPESSIIIEYLAEHRPGRTALVPRDTDVARQMRMRDRFYDLDVDVPMQKIVTDRLRPEGKNDPFGVERAKAQLETAYGMIEGDMAAKQWAPKQWAMGDAFTMADCAAAPALFYANKALPLGDKYPSTAKYLDRLKARPSFARVLEEAKPYLSMMPK